WLGGDYAGVGPGAHGRLGGEAFRQHRAPEAWLKGVEAAGHATRERQRLDPRTRAEELVMMGLRRIRGLDAERLAMVAEVIDPAGLARMVEGGFVEHDRDGLRATPAGRLLLSAVTAELLG
ncbi:MAG: coproporphyrinogen III oxidase, partial [Actinomycetota bacterium]